MDLLSFSVGWLLLTEVFCARALCCSSNVVSVFVDSKTASPSPFILILLEKTWII